MELIEDVVNMIEECDFISDLKDPLNRPFLLYCIKNIEETAYPYSEWCLFYKYLFGDTLTTIEVKKEIIEKLNVLEEGLN